MIINTNINALNAVQAYSKASTAYTQASTRISTQLQVNSAKDDPVGLGIANKWAAKIASYAKAVNNINDGITAVNVADSALSDIQSILTAMKTLATSSASSTDSATLASNQTLFASYMVDINSIANNAYYNGTSLLNGDTPTLTVQSGINAGDTTTLSFGSVLSSALGTGDALALTSMRRRLCLSMARSVYSTIYTVICCSKCLVYSYYNLYTKLCQPVKLLWQSYCPTW
jgi:flagellin